MRCLFALEEESILDVFSEKSWRYISTTTTERSMPVIFDSITHIPNLGTSLFGDNNQDPSYLIIPSEAEVQGRKIIRNDGTKVWAWDNLNIDAPIVSFGGTFDSVFIIGQISIQNHLSSEAKSIFNKIVRKIKAKSNKCNAVHVSDALFKAKRPLSFSTRIAKECDFTYDI